MNAMEGTSLLKMSDTAVLPRLKTASTDSLRCWMIGTLRNGNTMTENPYLRTITWMALTTVTVVRRTVLEVKVIQMKDTMMVVVSQLTGKLMSQVT